MWKLPKAKHKVFARNPLAAVVCAVDFDPILLIGEGKTISEFQNMVRVRFPQFIEAESMEVAISAASGVEVRKDKAFEFISEDGSAKISLNTRRIARETKDHRDSKELLSDVKLAIGALSACYSPISVNRVGLRYVNHIDEKQVSKDLGRDTNWSRLLSSEYGRLPDHVLDLAGTRFKTEITSQYHTGEMTLRYGLVRIVNQKEDRLLFDIDRYTAGAVNVDGIDAMLLGFVHDAYDLFIASVGSDLLEWMSQETPS